jgi:hypothetical protein
MEGKGWCGGEKETGKQGVMGGWDWCGYNGWVSGEAR